MSAIRLLAAPIDPASTPELSSSSTSLVHVPRRVLATPSDTSYAGDNYVWSVAVADNGSFQFYAAPQQNSRSSTSSQWSGSQQQALSAQWTSLSAPSATAQYAMYAAMPSITSHAHAIDIYA